MAVCGGVALLAIRADGAEAPKPKPPEPAQSTQVASPSKEIPLKFYQIAIEGLVVEVNERYTRQIGFQGTYVRTEGEPSIVRGVDVNVPNQGPNVNVPLQMQVIPGGFRYDGSVQRRLGAGIGFTGMDISDGRVYLRLHALIEEGKAQIRSRPLAVTLNRQPVKIETVDKVPYQDVVFDARGNSKIQVQFEEVGVKLHVTPAIKSLDEGLVDLDLTKLEVSAVGRFVNINDVQRPVFVKSEARTKVVVRNHDTLVIGGFKIEQESKAEQGIPFLRRIPILKYAFSNETKNLERRDVLFYITPHILAPGVQPRLPLKFEHRTAAERILQIPPPGAEW